jgi:glycosyltransferase involved in cell wall biosynthesis
MHKRKSIFFLVPYPKGKAPSQRFRFEQYFEVLKNEGVQYRVKSFYSNKTWDILHREGNVLLKITTILFSFLYRGIHVLRASTYSHVFIHREVAPIGPPFFEWIFKKVFKKKIIYDFDDAIWLPNYSEANTGFHKLKNYKKVNQIISWASIVSCGNDYLAEYSRKINPNVVINPTTIDTINYHNASLHIPNKDSDKVVIGWTGTHTTAKYLEFLVPVLKELGDKYDFEFCIISNQKPDFDLTNMNFIQWNKETEISDLMRFDIGVMPLDNNKWAKGKCGFKALQYMSLGIPTIASPVGVNFKIVDDKINGFLCSTKEEWFNALDFLLEDKLHRSSMSQAAIKKIEDNYSVVSNSKNFISLFSI